MRELRTKRWQNHPNSCTHTIYNLPRHCDWVREINSNEFKWAHRKSTASENCIRWQIHSFQLNCVGKLKNITIDFDWSRRVAWEQLCWTPPKKKRKRKTTTTATGTIARVPFYPSGHYFHTAECHLKLHQMNGRAKKKKLNMILLFFSFAEAHVQNYFNGLFMFIAFGMLIECLIELLHLIIHYYLLCALSAATLHAWCVCVFRLPAANFISDALWIILYFAFNDFRYTHRWQTLSTHSPHSAHSVVCQRFFFVASIETALGFFFYFFLRHPLNTK